MTQQEHFNRSVAVLVKAYFEGVLNHLDCAACACGNLVAAANNWVVKPHEWALSNGEESPTPDWFDVNRSTEFKGSFYLEDITPEGFRQVQSTGYTPNQFARIERSFMRRPADHSTQDEGNYLRLLQVVDVLAEIHNIDLATAEASKQLFVRA